MMGVRGFSLIELLVAVFIIVLLTGVVSLNVGTGGAGLRLEDEVRHIASLLSYASVESELSAADHGLLLTQLPDESEPRYQGVWLRRYQQGWLAPRANAEVLGNTIFDTGAELRLTLDGQPEVAILPHNPDLNPSPQILLLAGGEMTPGALDWLEPTRGAILYRLEWDGLGRMTLLPKGEIPRDD